MRKAIYLSFFIASFFLLSACNAKWNKEVSLSPEERVAIEQEIQENKAIIKQQIKNRTSGQAEPMAYVNLARGYVRLGELKKAEGVYKKAIKKGSFSSALHNNLARLYEDVEEYDKATEQYQILVEKFGEEQYLYDITWAYIHKKDRKAAEKYFNKWQRLFNTTDVTTQEAIKALRAKEDHQ